MKWYLKVRSQTHCIIGDETRKIIVGMERVRWKSYSDLLSSWETISGRRP